MNEERICGTCRYHHHENICDGWVCVNDASEHVTYYTEYDDSCEEWEGREHERKEKDNLR